MKTSFLSLILVFLCLSTFSTARTIYVDIHNTTVPRNGNSWNTAFRHIGPALRSASVGDHIWVAQGTYKISAPLEMVGGVALYGGFKGHETLLEQRGKNWMKYNTVIDGDGSVEHVIIGANNAILDGFTITGGNAVSLCGSGGPVTPSTVISCAGYGNGGGILCNQTAPHIRQCIIKDNYAEKGGGIYVMTVSVTMSDGRPTYSAGLGPIFEDCLITGNTADKRGGGASHDLYSNPIYINCTFTENVCNRKGGAVYNDFSCNPEFTNCLLYDNYAVRGAGIASDGSSNPKILFCTITQNRAMDIGAGLYTGSYNLDMTSPNRPEITNSIIYGNETEWGDPADLAGWHINEYLITNSLIGTGYTSFGSRVLTNTDPRFVDPASGDFHLSVDSPCKNHGTTSLVTDDLDGNTRDARPDAGCYEYK